DQFQLAWIIAFVGVMYSHRAAQQFQQFGINQCIINHCGCPRLMLYLFSIAGWRSSDNAKKPAESAPHPLTTGDNLSDFRVQLPYIWLNLLLLSVKVLIL